MIAYNASCMIYVSDYPAVVVPTNNTSNGFLGNIYVCIYYPNIFNDAYINSKQADISGNSIRIRCE